MKDNLTVSNGNSATSKIGTIIVFIPSGSSGGSSRCSGRGSPLETAKNVEVKKLSQAWITNGKTVKFDFTKNATCVA